MPTQKLNIIKPALGVGQLPDGDLLARLHAVHDGLLNNPEFPKPPVELADFKAAIDVYTAAVAASFDGGKAALIERDKCRNDVIVKYRLLGHYVEGACKNDMKTFVSSGFTAVTHQRTAPQPVTRPSILKVDQGVTGQFKVTVQPVGTGPELPTPARAGGG
jgi:hypothetical protein